MTKFETDLKCGLCPFNTPVKIPKCFFAYLMTQGLIYFSSSNNICKCEFYD